MGLTLLYRCIGYCSIFAGVTSYHYDHSRNEYKQTAATKLVATTANVLAVLGVPMGMAYIWLMISLFQHNMVLNLVVAIQSIIQIAAIMVTIFTRSKREQRIDGIINELLQLHTVFFRLLPRDKMIDLKYLLLFLVKVGCFAYIMVGDIWASFNFPFEYTWYAYILMVVRANTLAVLPLTTIHYFLMTAFIARDMVYVNKHLDRLVEELRRCGRPNGMHTFRHKQLHQLERVCCRLCRIANQLNTAYCMQMLASRATCFMTTISMGYFFFMFASHTQPSIIEVVSGLLMYAVMVFDLFLVDYLWYDLLGTHKATAAALRQFIEVPHLPSAIDRMCQVFATNLGTFQLRLVQAGLYEVDLRLWFGMVATVISYNIMLVQFDIVLSRQLPLKARNDDL